MVDRNDSFSRSVNNCDAYDGGPVFPVPMSDDEVRYVGLTKLDFYAGLAMAARLVGGDDRGQPQSAREDFDIAQAMVQECLRRGQ